MYLEIFEVIFLFCFDKRVSNLLIVGQLVTLIKKINTIFLIYLYKGQTSKNDIHSLYPLHYKIYIFYFPYRCYGNDRVQFLFMR